MGNFVGVRVQLPDEFDRQNWICEENKKTYFEGYLFVDIGFQIDELVFQVVEIIRKNQIGFLQISDIICSRVINLILLIL